MNKLKKNTNVEEMRSSIKIAITAMMIVLVCIVTMIFSVYLVSSNGFFNIGESVVYISAILFGPYVGAISGGCGSMLADLLLGFPHYAPGTLIIKGIEGYIVGYFFFKIRGINLSQKSWYLLTIFIGFLINLAVILIGFIYYQGLAYIGGYFGGTPIWEIAAEFNMILWIIIGVIGFISIVVIGYKYSQDIGLKIISMLLGGIIIVIGYLLYATFVLQYAGAFTEIPFNFLQSFIGILIAVPTISSLEKYSGVITYTRFRK